MRVDVVVADGVELIVDVTVADCYRINVGGLFIPVLDRLLVVLPVAVDVGVPVFEAERLLLSLGVEVNVEVDVTVFECEGVCEDVVVDEDVGV